MGVCGNDVDEVGMTWEGEGATVGCRGLDSRLRGNDVDEVGVTWVGAGVTVGLDSRLRGNDVDGRSDGTRWWRFMVGGSPCCGRLW